MVSQRNRDVYGEWHHIIPRSMGGTDESDNLVKLTFREHFIAHLLLVKITTGIDKERMARAVLLMGRYKTSRKWEQQRKAVRETLSQNHRNNVPLTFRGIEHRSAAEASRHTGVSTYRIHRELNGISLDVKSYGRRRKVYKR